LLQSKTTSDMDVGLPLLKNPQVLESVDDLTSLTYLHEAAVLSTVKTRYLLQHNIYTYSGIVLIAVNPFASLNIYHSSVAE
jgi:myosin-5